MPTLQLTVNGKPKTLNVDGCQTLLDVLRDDLALTGTKVGCREGECGACTVLLDGLAVNACLLPAMKAHKRDVITIEGIGDIEDPHPVQQHVADAGGVQCGYCTPGFVMSGVALIAHTPRPTHQEVQEALAGNLCRCTGYKRIVQGILDAADSMANDI